jgi:hypothetical protein
MQFWVQSVAAQLRIREIPVRLIYNDPNRSFGGPLDDPTHRLSAYRATMCREIDRCADRLPIEALCSERSGPQPCECGDAIGAE